MIADQLIDPNEKYGFEFQTFDVLDIKARTSLSCPITCPLGQATTRIL